MIDISTDMYIIRSAVCEAAAFVSAPHVRMKPKVFPDGDMWCCLYGENLMEGVAGFGKTAGEACIEFDRAWITQLTPAAVVAAKGVSA